MPASALRGASLRGAASAVLLCLMCAEGNAQTGDTSFQALLATTLPGDPSKTKRFDKFKWADGTAQANPPRQFTPPSVNGEATTGFDSDGSRKRTAKDNAKPQTGTPRASAIAPAASRSPYDVPPPALAKPAASGNSAYAAGAPGEPAVELGPIRQQPKKRKVSAENEDPYAPLGLRAGSLLLFPAVELIGGYDTNPSENRDGKGAGLYTVAPELRVQSDWSRHELTADLRGSYTGYSPDETPTLSRPYFNGKVDGRIDVLKTTRVDLGSRVLVSTENPGSPNLQAGLAELPIFTTYGGSVGLARRFNRFEIAIKGDAERTVFQDSELTDGSTASNETRNYDQFGGSLRGSYELTPGVKPFVEVGTDERVHDISTDLADFRRDSTGKTIKAGTTFELSRLLTGEIALGYTQREYDDPRLDKVSGFIGDGSLIWTASSLTTVKFTARSSVGESTSAGVSGILYRDAELQVDHALRRWLIGTVKLGFGYDDYVGSERNDNRYHAGLGLTYKINRTMQLKGEFRQEWLRSNDSDNDYDASIFLLGVRFQF